MVMVGGIGGKSGGAGGLDPKDLKPGGKRKYYLPPRYLRDFYIFNAEK